MGSYFKPLRRKIGVLTLVLACVFMAGWVRSFETTDEVIVPGKLLPGCKSRFVFYSSRRGLELERQWSDDNGADFSRPNGDYQSGPDFIFDRIDRNRLLMDSFQPKIDDMSAFCGFIAETGHLRHNGKVRAWVIPYWAIVVPMTLLSAGLLLSTASRTKPMATSNPAVESGPEKIV